MPHDIRGSLVFLQKVSGYICTASYIACSVEQSAYSVSITFCVYYRITKRLFRFIYFGLLLCKEFCSRFIKDTKSCIFLPNLIKSLVSLFEYSFNFFFTNLKQSFDFEIFEIFFNFEKVKKQKVLWLVYIIFMNVYLKT